MIKRNLSNKQRSKLSEKAAASEIGGRVQPGSGAIAGLKADAISDQFLLEDKFTDASSYNLKLDILKKVEREAFHKRRTPLLRVTIQGQTYYVLTRRAFLQLKQ